MKHGFSIDGGTLRVWFTVASDGDEPDKRSVQAAIAAMSPAGRAEFLRAARTLVQWFEWYEEIGREKDVLALGDKIGDTVNWYAAAHPDMTTQEIKVALENVRDVVSLLGRRRQVEKTEP